jgi:Methyl-accepting chemotaxis protein (MCP) signalling domain
MSHFNERPGTKLTIAAAIAFVVVAGMIADQGWLGVPLPVQHYLVEMSGLFVGLLVVGMLFGWALFSGFSIARSIHRTGDVLLRRGDRSPNEPTHDMHAAKTPWDNLQRVEQMESEQKVQPRGAAKLADQFQAAVGTLIGMGSPALTEREPPACTFTKTGQSAGPLAEMRANHFEASRSDPSVETVPAEMTILGDGIVSPTPASSITRKSVRQAVGHIDDALKSIPVIAEQINPPALVAVIAAVRAGEAGKGFAVVARELMALASQTAGVLEQLGIQIGEMLPTAEDSASASGTSRQASGAPERVHRRSPPQWKGRTRDAGRPPPRPRRRRSGLT